jgi:hypothetical protein
LAISPYLNDIQRLTTTIDRYSSAVPLGILVKHLGGCHLIIPHPYSQNSSEGLAKYSFRPTDVRRLVDTKDEIVLGIDVCSERNRQNRQDLTNLALELRILPLASSDAHSPDDIGRNNIVITPLNNKLPKSPEEIIDFLNYRKNNPPSHPGKETLHLRVMNPLPQEKIVHFLARKLLTSFRSHT